MKKSTKKKSLYTILAGVMCLCIGCANNSEPVVGSAPDSQPQKVEESVPEVKEEVGKEPAADTPEEPEETEAPTIDNADLEQFLTSEAFVEINRKAEPEAELKMKQESETDSRFETYNTEGNEGLPRKTDVAGYMELEKIYKKKNGTDELVCLYRVPYKRFISESKDGWAGDSLGWGDTFVTVSIQGIKIEDEKMILGSAGAKELFFDKKEAENSLKADYLEIPIDKVQANSFRYPFTEKADLKISHTEEIKTEDIFNYSYFEPCDVSVSAKKTSIDDDVKISYGLCASNDIDTYFAEAQRVYEKPELVSLTNSDGDSIDAYILKAFDENGFSVSGEYDYMLSYIYIKPVSETMFLFIEIWSSSYEEPYYDVDLYDIESYVDLTCSDYYVIEPRDPSEIDMMSMYN